MGRHTKDLEDGVPEGKGSRRRRGLGKVPLLPTVSGVVAIGAVVSAISTQQISLNFAGGAPPPGLSAEPQRSDSAQPDARHGRHNPRDHSSLARRKADRASRGSARAAVTVAFRTVSTSRAGFQGQVTITNRAAEPVRGWTLMLRYPHSKIISAWDGKIFRKGDTLVMGNPAEHPSIAPGRSVKVTFNADGAGAGPVACSFNGRSC